MIGRRPLLLGLTAAVCGGSRGLLAAAPPSGRIAFQISRKGDPIGSHTLVFTRDGNTTQVDIAIELKITVAFIPVYRYSHRNLERWREGRLTSIDTSTDDDGERFFVKGINDSSGLRVESSAGSRIFPSDIIPTSYWNPLTVNAPQLLNSQNGVAVKASIAPQGADQIQTAQGAIEAKHFSVSGDLKLEVWYDSDDVLARIRFRAERDGSVIDYRRV